MQTKKKTQEATNLTVRVSLQWLEKLDEWRESQPVAPTRSQLVKVAVEKFMADNPSAKKSPVEF